MGDEFRGCPECGERLAFDARACACGWRSGGGKRGKSEGPRHDMTCTWKAGDLQCAYPVGLFMAGEIRGMCVFHRMHPAGTESAYFARLSRTDSPDDYRARAAATIYREESPAVKALRAKLRTPRSNPSEGLSRFLLSAPTRQPGEDEEAA